MQGGLRRLKQSFPKANLAGRERNFITAMTLQRTGRCSSHQRQETTPAGKANDYEMARAKSESEGPLKTSSEFCAEFRTVNTTTIGNTTI